MKITHVITRLLRAPADNPFVVGIATGDAVREYVTVEVHTDQGIDGIYADDPSVLVEAARRESSARRSARVGPR